MNIGSKSKIRSENMNTQLSTYSGSGVLHQHWIIGISSKVIIYMN